MPDHQRGCAITHFARWLTRCRRGIGFVLAALLAGCGLLAGLADLLPDPTLPPAWHVTSLVQVTGKWEGVFRGPNGQPTVIEEQIIRAAGTWESLTPWARHTGVVQVVDGKLRGRNLTSGRTSTWTLYEGRGRRVLIAVNDDGSGASELTPAKP